MNYASRQTNDIPKALKIARVARGLSQEDFGLVSSRTYISTLERGLKSPTLSKLDSLVGPLKVHPLTLLTLAYLNDPSSESPDELLQMVQAEINDLRGP